jgi:hypothetical protein
MECTFYQPINQGWFEDRAKTNGATHEAQPAAKV